MIFIKMKPKKFYIYAHILKRVEKVNKKVLCVESNTVFNSVKEASQFTGADASSIVRVCKKKQSKAKGLTFTYLDPV